MPTHYPGTPAEKQALDVYIKLARAADTVTARINSHLYDFNLTVSQFGVLEALYHLGPMHQNELAEKILKSSGNMTLVIDNLSKRHLVKRQRDTQDRRRVQVHLTEKGERLIAQIFPKHVQIVVEVMGILNDGEQRQLEELCRKIGLGVDEAAV